MRTIIVEDRQNNKKIDRAIKEIFPEMPLGALYKAFRKKDIKVNGTRVKEDFIVKSGDKLEIYIVDDILENKPVGTEFQLNIGFTAVYEDKNIIIVNKEPGIPVHPDKENTDKTLIELVQNYLIATGAYNNDKADSFKPSLCHRLDRNTGGLIIIAKNNDALKILLNKIKLREIKKYYLCMVNGKMERDSAELKAYLEKDENKSRVFINSRRSKNSLEIITRYKVLSYENCMSLLEVELVTGRTHQIRAHLAFIGHPIIGDGKYGLNTVNRSLGAKYQALWAYKIAFDFDDAGILSYLKGKTFEVKPEFKIYL